MKYELRLKFAALNSNSEFCELASRIETICHLHNLSLYICNVSDLVVLDWINKCCKLWFN
jgi:hypothetical protein